MKPLNRIGPPIFVTIVLVLLLPTSVISTLPPGLDPVLAQAEKRVKIIKVRKDGTGDFKTINEAIKSIPSGNTQRRIVWIGSGVYKEKIVLDPTKPFITFYAKKEHMPTLVYDDDSGKVSLLHCASTWVQSDYFVAVNINFVNSAPKPDGRKGAQAVAFRISGDKAAFYNCRFIGFQDTLCDDRGYHFFKDCYIEGTVDFIFGNGKSIYKNCELHSVSDGLAAITAQARKSDFLDTGFSFINCKITGTGDIYLGRAWKDRTLVVFAYTHMDFVVNPKGWSGMGPTGPDHIPKGVLFGEYKCMGPGARTSLRRGARILTDEEAKPYLDMNFIHADKWLRPPPRLI